MAFLTFIVFIMGAYMEKTKFYAVSMVTVFLFCLFNVIYAGNFSGELGEVKGKVEILKDGEKDWIPAVEEMPLQLKDRVKTYAESTCNLELDDGSIINVGDNTDILVENLEISSDKHESKFSLFFGKMIANISKMRQTKMNIHTPTSVLAVRGTEFAVEASSEEAKIGVFDGEVAVKSAIESDTEEEVKVKPNEETTVLKDEKPQPPRKLEAVMLKYKERNDNLRQRAQMLRERLKRVPPGKRAVLRKKALDRFQKLKNKRAETLKKEKRQQRMKEER